MNRSIIYQWICVLDDYTTALKQEMFSKQIRSLHKQLSNQELENCHKFCCLQILQKLQLIAKNCLGDLC